MRTETQKSSAGWLAASGVALYVAAIPFETIFLVEEGVSLLRWLGVALILLLSATILALGRVRTAGPLQWIPLVLCFWAAASLAWSADSVAWLKCAQVVLLACISLMIISAPWDESEISLISVATVVGGLIAASVSIYRFASGVEYLGYVPRASLGGAGVEQDPNYFAASLLLPLFLAVRMAVKEARGSRLYSSLAASVLATAIVLSGSRGAVLGMIAGLVVGALLLRSLRVRFIALLMAGTLLTGYTLPRVSPAVSERFNPTFTTLDQNSARLDIWAVGKTAFFKSPFWGTGIGMFPRAFEAARPATYGIQPLGPNAVSHNLPLGVAVELGSVGLLIWGIWIYAVFRFLWRANPGREFLSGAFVAVLVSTLFLDAFTDRYYWISIAVFVAAKLTTDKHSNPEYAEPASVQGAT